MQEPLEEGEQTEQVVGPFSDLDVAPATECWALKVEPRS
jgi:hypothetical protein